MDAYFLSIKNEGNSVITIIKLMKLFQVGAQLVDHPDRCTSPSPSPYSPIPPNLSPPINNKENDENINWAWLTPNMVCLHDCISDNCREVNWQS